MSEQITTPLFSYDNPMFCFSALFCHSLCVTVLISLCSPLFCFFFYSAVPLLILYPTSPVFPFPPTLSLASHQLITHLLLLPLRTFSFSSSSFSTSLSRRTNFHSRGPAVCTQSECSRDTQTAHALTVPLRKKLHSKLSYFFFQCGCFFQIVDLL